MNDLTVTDNHTEGEILDASSRPVQLELLQENFFDKDRDLSNTYELYDQSPIYSLSPNEVEKLRQKSGGNYLPIQTREFKHRGVPYTLKVTPALITDGEKDKHYYPTLREETVEKALQKLARQPGKGVFIGGQMGVQFTLSELKRELARTGHDTHLDALKQSLEICTKTIVEYFKAGDGKKAMMSSPIFPMLLLANREDYEKDPANCKCYVKFNPLVTIAVEELNFRQFDVDEWHRHKQALSKWLYKRLSHNYTQANIQHPYQIRLTTIMRDSAMSVSERNKDNHKRVVAALDEMKDRGHIVWRAEETRGARNKLENVLYTIHPSFEFTDTIKRANATKNKILERATEIEPELFPLPFPNKQ